MPGGYVSNDEACGSRMLSTKEGFVEVLCFKQFYKHFVFVEDEEGNRKKRVEKYFEVDVGCGGTKNSYF